MPRSTCFQNRNNKIYVCLCVSFFFFLSKLLKSTYSCWQSLEGTCPSEFPAETLEAVDMVTLQKAKGTTLQLDWAVAGLDSSQEQMGLIYKHMHVCLCECVCASKKSQLGHCHSFPTMLQAYIRRNLIKSINCSGGMLRCNIWWSGYRKPMKTT